MASGGKMVSKLEELLPKEIVQTLDTYLDEGKFVNDFRITGNAKGFSVTIHFCNPPCGDPDTWSPGIKHKSPSARHYDQQRRLQRERSITSSSSWIEHMTPGNFNNKATSCDFNTAVELVNNSKSTNVAPCDLDNVGFNVNISAVVNSHGCNGDTHMHSDNHDNSSITVDHNQDTGDGSDESDVDECIFHDNEGKVKESATETVNTKYSRDEAEKRYKDNIMNKSRNRAYKKTVHDTRNGQSKVYGLSDDMIISVDEQNKKYESWGIHDKDDDARCDEIFQLLQKWTSASSKRCKYGIDTLNILLPDIIEKERQAYSVDAYGK